MLKRESEFGILFRHWVFANAKDLKTCSFEIKDAKGKDMIPFSSVEDHQVNYSLAIKNGDKGTLTRVASGTMGAPDYLFLKREPAYIVIRFYKLFCVIDIEAFEKARKNTKRKSLTKTEAMSIAYKVVLLK